ncbi:hypothetical protein AAOGI_32440 [Agarivorans albus]
MFFGFALLAGVFWIAGKEIEPVAFLLGLLSSLFLASPSVAQYFVPDRKAVRDMTFEEVLDFITTTDAKVDWKGISTDWSSEYFLTEDPRLRFRMNYLEDGIQNSNFVEPWANCHADTKARGYWCDLYYDGSFIDRLILVAVDGGRSLLPAPEAGTLEVLKYNYCVAEIHDTLNTLTKYMKRSKLAVRDS